MPLSSFHPLVARWFRETLGEPTAAQRVGWGAIREGRHTLIAAPTGSGKTLAAFLTALDELFCEGERAPLRDEVRVVYVSPLKALSADIHKNLAEPRAAIRRLAGDGAPRITAAVRTGDTTSSERAAMLRTPPHILVTTPESLYLLLTAERSRNMLRTVRTVIVDEVHAVIGTRRGAHLALTLERLQQVAERPLLRIGLSATQKPIEEVARYLVGTREEPCAIVDEGHRRTMDLTLELPKSQLDAVMSHEVWEDYYDRLTELIAEHRTTLVFVNTRRMAERVARHLADRLGDEAVTAHHGSLSKENRLDAETRLRDGSLKALVATASLELGIDIGHVDLVCQIGSPHRIATLLQRVGRSGHSVSGLPKGRLFPVSRDDLMECASLLRAVKRGELDRIVVHDAPLDVLAQQLTAEASCDEYDESALYALARRAWPYRELGHEQFVNVLTMLADGFTTSRGRRGALVHRDEVNGRVRGRRGSRMLALTSGGAIPEIADYRVVLEGDETFIGTLNEDFAIESTAGDIFQLGNTSWQITQVLPGEVRVTDAKGAPPSIPFWLGEAPARSDELSRAVSELRRDIEPLLVEGVEGEGWAGSPHHTSACSAHHASAGSPPHTTLLIDGELASPGVVWASSPPPSPDDRVQAAIEWLIAETGMPLHAAEQAIAYLAEGRRALGCLPTQETLILERFFDEAGGMQLVLHAPFGSRVNRAWGLALRKRFCRQFNFELQAAATEDALLLSLGPQHSFPLSDVFRYLHPNTVKDVLVQAFLDAPVFQTRWRWNTTISLAVPRNRGGRKVAPQIQRMMAADLMASCFPDAAACFENIGGDRQIPDHPLVQQVVRDCLHEAMDFDGLAKILTRIHAGEIECVARDTREPSVLSYDILNAKPYAFLDDAPLEERRTQAVLTRRAGDTSAGDLGALDLAAIERVRDEERPDPRDADELHDALLTVGFLTEAEAAPIPRELFETLVTSRRAGKVMSLWIAAERLPELLAVHPGSPSTLVAPPSRMQRAWMREEAIVELLRGRMSIAGPITAHELARSLSIEESDAELAMITLESEGVVFRGSWRAGVPPAGQGASRPLPESRSDATLLMSPGTPPGATPGGSGRDARRPGHEWCDRRLLARIHRYTLVRLRAEIEPVGAHDFLRFLFAWQHVLPATRLTGVDGLSAVVSMLDGYEVAASAWERSVLPARIDGYEPSMLDMLCLTGEVAWARLSPASGTSPVGSTPIAFVQRAAPGTWRRTSEEPVELSELARRALEVLRTRGASFPRELGFRDDEELQRALGELVSAGLVASDGFAGLRALIGSQEKRPKASFSGRWSLLDREEMPREEAVEAQARTLLRRYGVVFRRLLTREPNAAPWRELARIYRRLEARGEIRGGRFVSGMSGEQFALPQAIERLREIRREGASGSVVVLSAADPLNLTGILTSGERIRAAGTTRIAYRDGVAVSVLEGEVLRPLVEVDERLAGEVANALAGRRVPVTRGFVGRAM